MDRRAFLAAVPLGALTACTATNTHSASPVSTPATEAPASSTSTTTSSSPNTVEPTVEPTAEPTKQPTRIPDYPPTPTADAGSPPTVVAARYAGRKPTTWGIDVQGIDASVPAAGGRTLALTFDACGGPGGSRIDTGLVELLRRNHVPATLFLNQRWVQSNRAYAEQLVADPLFHIGNHGTRHLPLSVSGRSAYGVLGTRSAQEVVDEVWGNHEYVRSLTGQAPTWFRCGTAHYDEVAVAIVRDLGYRVAGFATNGDSGATFTAAQVTSALTHAANGIVIMHMNQPGRGTMPGVAAALPTLKAAGTTFVHLT
ncbi:MAG TPA: polysaccharide deacetylase family protein [Lapillicoccus sp.]